MEKLGKEPAFPNTDGSTFCNDGISKRLYIATMAMQGMLSGAYQRSTFVNAMDNTDYILANNLAEDAFCIADKMLELENE